MGQLTRRNLTQKITISNVLDDSTVIKYGEYTSGSVAIPANLAGNTTLTWYAATSASDKAEDEQKPGAFKIAQDESGADITSALTADRHLAIPLSLIGCRFIKAVADTAVLGDTLADLKG